MKKVFFLGIAAVAMLASCSNDETVEMVQNTRTISFNNAFIDNATRSVVDPSFTTLNLQSFAVYGFTQNGQIFDGVTVSKDGTGSTWLYSPQQYWVEGNQYAFGAIAPANTPVSEEQLLGSSVSDYKVGMTVSFTNTDGKTDLLYAAADNVDANESFMADPQLVGLTFKHQLSKVKFSFLNNVSGAYNIKVTDVKITNAKSTGTLTVSSAADNSWSNVGGSALELDFGAAGSAETTADAIAFSSEGETYNELLMIPTASTESYTVTFTVELLNGTVSMGTYNHTATISNVELKLGYCYDFKAELNADNIVVDPEDPDAELKPIEFTVSGVEDWNQTDRDQTVDIPTGGQ